MGQIPKPMKLCTFDSNPGRIDFPRKSTYDFVVPSLSNPGTSASSGSMSGHRTFSTRELAQIWNVSESTVKRWAHTGVLSCSRTPGGHRRFSLEDISRFQNERGFEATGLLTGEKWEVPEVEVLLNQKRFDRVCELVQFLALENRRHQIKALLERLYLRGVTLAELYDEVLLPVTRSTRQACIEGKSLLGQVRLAMLNLEYATEFFFPNVVRRRPNGKTALCGSGEQDCRLHVGAVSHVLEVEGWESLNVGGELPFPAMAEMVEREPINLVCVVSECADFEAEPFKELVRAAEEYRISLILAGEGFSELETRRRIAHDDYAPDLRSLRRLVNHPGH